MISLRPLTARLTSRILRKSLIESSERTVELAPSTIWEVDPPVMLADEPDRIVGHSPDSDPATNLLRLTQRTIEQGPTRMHLLRDVLIGGGAVLARTAYDRLAPGSRSPVLLGQPEQLAEAALCTDYVSEKYFGHWLKDGVCHELLAEDQGLLPLVLDLAKYAHREQYREILSLHPRRSSLVHCDRLWLLTDHETNRDFVDRYERLRKRVGPAAPSTKIFLSRPGSVGRRLINEEEIRSALPDFVFIEPDHLSANELGTILSKASIVVSPEGSAISHATIAMPSGSTLLTIIGAQHFNMPYKVLCDALCIRFGLTIADAAGGDDFSQPPGRLLKTIDACLSKAVY